MIELERVITQVALLASDRLKADVRSHVRSGGLVAYPTATVYGIGGQVGPAALSALDGLKKRPADKPYLLLIDRVDRVSGLHWTDEARRLADRFWPGPLTLVLGDPDSRFPERVRGPEGGVAVRRTGHLGARALLAAADGPITSSSANEPGGPPATSGAEAAAVLTGMGAEGVWLIDGGRLPESPSSTLVDCVGNEPKVLREGAIPKPDVEATIDGVRAVESPGSVAGGIRPVRITFVCTGNTCRSPMAEAIARARLGQLGWSGVEVTSAGVYAAPGHPASPEGVQVAERRGVDLTGHRSSPLTGDLLLESDLVLTMGPGHLEALWHSEGAARSSTLGAFADGREDPFDGVAVPDPIGMGLETYEGTFERIESMIGLAFARLAPVLGVG